MNAPLDAHIALTPAQSECRQAFTRMFRAHYCFVRSVLRRFGVQPSALDDVTQEVFMTVYRRWGSLHAPGLERSWLYGIARRHASNYRRKMARYPLI